MLEGFFMPFPEIIRDFLCRVAIRHYFCIDQHFIYMKQQKLTFLLTLLMSMMGIDTIAHDIAVANSDGVTIYYKWTNNKTELSVSYRGSSYSDYTNEYTGSVVIPETVTYNGTTYSVTSIGYEAFSYCSAMTSIIIPNSVTGIGYSAFNQCSGLTSVTIPNSVTNINYDAFAYCSGLTSLTIGNSVKSIGSGAFYNCSSLTEVNYNATNCTSMGDYNGRVFSKCSSLATLNIGDNVQNIPSYAFSNCYGVTDLTIPNSVTSICNAAFNGCSGLTSLTIPNSVTSIGDYAFSSCSKLESVTIGTGVLNIGSSIFSGHRPAKVIWLTNTPPSGYSNAAGTINYVANNLYTSLSNKTEYKFLSSLFEVEGVKYVPVSPSERTCDAIDCLYNDSAENIHIGKTVTNKSITLTVKQVHPYAFYGNPYIKDVELNIDYNVGDYTFNGCTGLTG